MTKLITIQIIIMSIPILRILFDTRDVSRVKQFAQRQFAKILSGRASIQDLTFAKEFRGVGSGRIE